MQEVPGSIPGQARNISFLIYHPPFLLFSNYKYPRHFLVAFTRLHCVVILQYLQRLARISDSQDTLDQHVLIHMNAYLNLDKFNGVECWLLLYFRSYLSHSLL